jgi:hypothetical protein
MFFWKSISVTCLTMALVGAFQAHAGDSVLLDKGTKMNFAVEKTKLPRGEEGFVLSITVNAQKKIKSYQQYCNTEAACKQMQVGLESAQKKMSKEQKLSLSFDTEKVVGTVVDDASKDALPEMGLFTLHSGATFVTDGALATEHWYYLGESGGRDSISCKFDSEGDQLSLKAGATLAISTIEGVKVQTDYAHGRDCTTRRVINVNHPKVKSISCMAVSSGSVACTNDWDTNVASFIKGVGGKVGIYLPSDQIAIVDQLDEIKGKKAELSEKTALDDRDAATKPSAADQGVKAKRQEASAAPTI